MKESTQVSDHLEKNSVYDFLYHDVKRINSFLSQFNPNGLLQSSTILDSNSQTQSTSSTNGLKVKLPAVVEGDKNKSDQTSEIIKEELSKTYDPFWQNSLAFLDYLVQNQLLNEDINKSNIGQFVLLSGKLFMFDVSFFQKVLMKSHSKQSFIGGFVGASTNSKTAKNDAHEFLDVIDALPNSIQARLVAEDFSTWSTLYADGLSLSPDDLLLKHGFIISGEWKVLGILDALPDHDNTNEDYSFLPDFQRILANYSNILRPKFGRDTSSYGITPLMIFRKVSGNEA